MSLKNSIWQTAPENLKLVDGEVHVWLASLRQTKKNPHFFRNLLAQDERERANRFRKDRDRDRWTIGRGLLRITLGHYLRLAPDEIEFDYNSHGKPSVSPGQNKDLRLSFNISHSGERLLCAIVAGQQQLGVDIEFKGRELDFVTLADRFFSPNEATILKGLSRNLWRDGFYNCWTCKEAFVKAKGEGLTLPLNEFEVSFVPNSIPEVKVTARNPDEAGQWSMTRLLIDNDYAAALAIKGAGWHVRQFRMPE